jgi:hypothetical protein
MSFSINSRAIDEILLKHSLETPREEEPSAVLFEMPETVKDWSEDVWRGLIVGLMVSPHPIALASLASHATAVSPKKITTQDVKNWLEKQNFNGDICQWDSGSYWVPNCFQDAAREYLNSKFDSEGFVSKDELKKVRLQADSIQFYLNNKRELVHLPKSIVTKLFIQRIQDEITGDIVDLESIAEGVEIGAVMKHLDTQGYIFVSERFLVKLTLSEDVLLKLDSWISASAESARSNKGTVVDLATQISQLLPDAPPEVVEYLNDVIHAKVKAMIVQRSTSVFVARAVDPREVVLSNKVYSHLEALKFFPPESALHTYFFESFESQLSKIPSLKEAAAKMDVDALLELLPVSDQVDMEPIRQSLQSADAALVLHAATLLFFHKTTGKSVFASGKFIPTILKTLAHMPNVNTESQEMLVKAQKSVLKSLKAPMDLTSTIQAIREMNL